MLALVCSALAFSVPNKQAVAPALRLRGGEGLNFDTKTLNMAAAIYHEEVLPLVDVALHNQIQQRTPGTLLFECTRAVAGYVPAHAAADPTLERRSQLLARIHAAEAGRQP